MARPEAAEILPVAQNRKARYNYFIEDTLEAGIMLTGTEVKSLRSGKSNITDAHAAESKGELWLFNLHIPEYGSGNRFNHEPRRPRKLLLHKRQISKLVGAIQRQGVTIVPLQIYFNKRGMAKVELGLATGKKQYDKRATEKTRDWNREKQRVMRNKGRE
jgi:SsrA-binding protein